MQAARAWSAAPLPAHGRSLPDYQVPKLGYDVKVTLRTAGRYTLRLRPNGVKLSLHRCKIACVARRGQQVVAGDRLPDRMRPAVRVGVLLKIVYLLTGAGARPSGVRRRRVQRRRTGNGSESADAGHRSGLGVDCCHAEG